MELPPLSLLDEAPTGVATVTPDVAALSRTLAAHGAAVEHVAATVGPQVVSYQVRLEDGVRTARVSRLVDEVSLAMNATARYAGIRGDRVVFEVGRHERAGVTLRECVENGRALIRLGFVVGRTTLGGVRIDTLADLPHLIVAGTTGSGKSVFLHSLLVSILMRNTPDDVALHLIDPKRVELAAYENAPHVRSLTVDPFEASNVLKRASQTMDARYDDLKRAGHRDIEVWNNVAPDGERWGRVVVVVEELSDLLMSPYGKQVEHELSRIAQLGRAAGVHLVMATQRPSAKILPERVRANVPARVVFATATPSDANVALGRPGGTGLLGSGDGLFIAPGNGAPDPIRVQAPFVSAAEVERVVTWWQMQAAPAEPPAIVTHQGETLREVDEEGERLRASLAAYAESSRHVDDDLVVPLSPEEKLAHLGLDDDEVLDYLAARVLERAAAILEKKEATDA